MVQEARAGVGEGRRAVLVGALADLVALLGEKVGEGVRRLAPGQVARGWRAAGQVRRRESSGRLLGDAAGDAGLRVPDGAVAALDGPVADQRAHRVAECARPDEKHAWRGQHEEDEGIACGGGGPVEHQHRGQNNRHGAHDLSGPPSRIGADNGIKVPKSGRVRSVPLISQLAIALAQLGQREHFTGEDDLVFGNVVGEVEHDNLIRRRYYRALKAAGLPRVRFHDLRHVFGSTAVKAFPLSDVQAMLGHAHVTTTMRYVHHRPGKDDAARLAAAFDGESVSPLVSRTGDTEGNSAQLSDPESTE